MRVFGVIMVAATLAVVMPLLGGLPEAAAELLQAAAGRSELLRSANPLVARVVVGVMMLVIALTSGYGTYVALFGAEREKHGAVAWANALAKYVEYIARFVLLVLVGIAIKALHPTRHSPVLAVKDALGGAADRLHTAVTGVAPTLVTVPSIVSSVFAVAVAGLSFYLFHLLMHHSRALWLMFHRSHHVPSFLTGLNAPVALFAVFVSFPFQAFPRLIAASLIEKMLPARGSLPPLLFVFMFCADLGDITSHSTVLYRVCARNPVLRFFFHFSAGGPHHYMHHSSKPDEQAINLASLGPFYVWDKLFGTYRAPTMDPPPIGLTNDPEIRLSPFAIVFSGYQQIAYELRMNKSWRTRARILFGSVKYTPPITRSFLMLDAVPEREAEPEAVVRAA